MLRLFFVFTTIVTSLQSWGNDYSFDLIADIKTPNQSAANYGRYLFAISDKMEYFVLFDLEKKKTLYTLHQSPYKKKNKNQIVYHCNQCCFGTQKFEEPDFFPLLYISQRNESDSTGAFITVVRIVAHRNNDQEIDSFAIRVVQKIYFPPMTDDNCLGLPGAVIDKDMDYIYTYSRNINPHALNYTGARISKFKVPKCRINGKLIKIINFKETDIVDSFSCNFNLSGAQGGVLHNGKIYLTQGAPRKEPQKNFVFFRVIDIAKRKCTKMIDMLTNGFCTEPEGCWVYNDSLMILDNKGKMYSLSGNIYKIN